MTLQEKRSLVYFVSNMIVTAAYMIIIGLFFGSRIMQTPNDTVFWAIVILIYIPVQIVMRIIINVILAIQNEIAKKEESLSLEDEMDKLIDLKSSRTGSYFFMVGFIISLILLAMGLPVFLFFTALCTGLILSGLAGDLCLVVLYKTGV